MLFWDHYTFWGSWTKRWCCWLHGWHTFPKYFWLDFCIVACVYHVVLSHRNSVFLALFSSSSSKFDQFVRFLYSIFVVGRRIEGRGETEGARGGGALQFLNQWKQVVQTHIVRRTIKVFVSDWRCPGTSTPSAPHQTVSFYHYTSGSYIGSKVEGS